MDDNLSSFSCLVQVVVACTYMYYYTGSLNTSSLLIPGLGEVEGEEGSIGSIASPRSVPQTAERGLWRAGESSEEGRQQLPLLVLLDLIYCHNHLLSLPSSLPPSSPGDHKGQQCDDSCCGRERCDWAGQGIEEGLPTLCCCCESSFSTLLKCSQTRTCIVLTKPFIFLPRPWLASLTSSRRRNKMS